MDTTTTKVFVIIGLFLVTLLVSLLPLLCLKFTMHLKRKSLKQKRKASNSLFHKLLFCIGSAKKEPLSQENECAIGNDELKSSTAEIRKNRFRKKMLLSVLNCFAGGIFLGTSFIGLLPEIRKGFSKADITWPDLTSSPEVGNETLSHEEAEQMPLAEMFVVLGLFFILCVEQAAHSCNHWRQKQKTLKKKNKIILCMTSNKEFNVEERIASDPALSSSSSLSDVSIAKPRHDHSGIRSLMLVATLSIHSLLEGMAIGLQKTSRSVFLIFIGVLLHKALMAFSMGSNLVHSKLPLQKILIAALIFSCSTPIGIAIGIGIDSSGGNNDSAELINAFFQAIATGTFLYITFFEVLVQEFEAHGNRLAKVLALFMGYGSVLITSFFGHH